MNKYYLPWLEGTHLVSCVYSSFIFIPYFLHLFEPSRFMMHSSEIFHEQCRFTLQWLEHSHVALVKIILRFCHDVKNGLSAGQGAKPFACNFMFLSWNQVEKSILQLNSKTTAVLFLHRIRQLNNTGSQRLQNALQHI